MADGYLLEIRRGASGTSHLLLQVGTPVEPLTVGLRGQWRVEADGIADVHAFVCFDGQALFVQPATPIHEVRINGERVPPQWTPVSAPSTLSLGDARLFFHDAADGPAFGATRPPAPPRPPQPPAPPDDFGEDAVTHALPVANFEAMPRFDGPRSSDRGGDRGDERTGDIPLPAAFDERRPAGEDEATQVLPVPDGYSGAHPKPVAPPGMPFLAPAPPMPSWNASSGPFPTQQGAHPPAVIVAPLPAPTNVPPRSAARAKLDAVLAQLVSGWKEASLPKKAILCLLPVAFVFVIIGFRDDERPAPRAPRTMVAASASSSAPSSGKTAPIASSAAPTVSALAPTVATATAKGAPSIAPTPSTSPSSASSSAPGVKSVDRAAVDAVASGALREAARLYAQLAADHPENEAYREAARILRQKTGGK